MMRNAAFLLLMMSGACMGSVIANQGTIALGVSAGTSNFGGPDFQGVMGFEWGSGGPIFNGTLTSSTTVPVNASMLFGNGTLTYQGTPYTIPNPVSDTTGTMVTAVLTGSPIAITGAGTFFGTFTGSGVMRIRTTNNPFAPYNVDDTWSGQGIVTITVTTNPLGPGQTNFIVTSQTYTFTPEPGTWAMLGLGGVAVFLRRRLQA